MVKKVPEKYKKYLKSTKSTWKVQKVPEKYKKYPKRYFTST